MKKWIMFVMMVAMVSSLNCSESGASIKKEIIKNADEIVIFASALEDGVPVPDSQRTKYDSKKEIKKIMSFISDKDAPQYKCGYTGSIDVLKNGKSVLEEDMQFNLKPECRHIVYVYKDKVYFKQLTDEGVEFLSNLF